MQNRSSKDRWERGCGGSARTRLARRGRGEGLAERQAERSENGRGKMECAAKVAVSRAGRERDAEYEAGGWKERVSRSGVDMGPICRWVVRRGRVGGGMRNGQECRNSKNGGSRMEYMGDSGGHSLVIELWIGHSERKRECAQGERGRPQRESTDGQSQAGGRTAACGFGMRRCRRRLPRGW